METIDRETYAGCVRLCERAVKTIMALPDAEQRFIYPKSNGWPEYVQSAQDAYKATEERCRFIPTRRDVSNCEVVLDWLTWLKRQSGAEHEFKVIWAHSLGASYFRLAGRFGKHEKTMRRWHENGIMRICAQFEHEIEKMLD